MWPKLVSTTHEREWRVFGLWFHKYALCAWAEDVFFYLSLIKTRFPCVWDSRRCSPSSFLRGVPGHFWNTNYSSISGSPPPCIFYSSFFTTQLFSSENICKLYTCRIQILTTATASLFPPNISSMQNFCENRSCFYFMPFIFQMFVKFKKCREESEDTRGFPAPRISRIRYRFISRIFSFKSGGITTIFPHHSQVFK